MIAPAPPRAGRKYFSTVPPQEIVPVIDGDYESSVKGVYVIGDVTGLPLVKIAANHGVEVIERMAASGAVTTHSGDDRSAESGSDAAPLDVVIIGGGPAGLSAGIEAAKRGLRYVILERSHVANTVRGFPPGKKVYAEPRHLGNQSELPVGSDHDKAEFLAMVDEAVTRHGLRIKEDSEVKHIKKRGEHDFVVEDKAGKEFAAKNVVIAIGRQGNPRKLGVPGEDKAHKVLYRLHTPKDYEDDDVLIVGGGNSAIEAALLLMEHNRVTISYRKDEFFRLKADNKKLLEQAVAEGKLEVIYESNVREIRDDAVVLDVKGEARVLKNDYTLVLAGTLPPIEFLLDAGLELDGIWTAKRVVYCLIGIAIGYFVYFQSKHFTLLEEKAGPGTYHIPGLDWLFAAVHPRFANLYSMYYLLYFIGIAVFGVYWGMRYKNRLIWRKQLSNIFFNWTLWWGLPTLLVSLYGTNAWTPVLNKTVNAWPLNMTAFDIQAAAPGQPQWWTTVAIVGAVWAVILTFVVLPLFTIYFGKYYCSHLCSCGALAETVGGAFRHRGPKGDLSRWLERFGYVFIPLAAVATLAHMYGWEAPFGYYNSLVGTFLAGALAIGAYPFLGQRVWCRYWCPLAFWMNFWGRWSKFKISAEPGKCIDCGVCNQYCQMGIDIKSKALQGSAVTLRDSPCVGCAECVVRCPMEILHLGDLPDDKKSPDTPKVDDTQLVFVSLQDSLDIPRINDLSHAGRATKS